MPFKYIEHSGYHHLAQLVNYLIFSTNFSSQKYLKSDKNLILIAALIYVSQVSLTLNVLIFLWTLLDQQLKRRCLRLLAKVLRNHVL